VARHTLANPLSIKAIGLAVSGHRHERSIGISTASYSCRATSSRISGGEFGPNVFRQDRRLNRGWSEPGDRRRVRLVCDRSDGPVSGGARPRRAGPGAVHRVCDRFDAFQ